MIKAIFVLTLLYSFSFAYDCTVVGFKQIAGVISESELNAKRSNEENFTFEDPKCCCNKEIIALAERTTREMNKRFFPANDNVIRAVQNTCLITKEIKQENKLWLYELSMYSFFQKRDRDREMYNKIPSKSAGCVALDPNSPEAIQFYLDTVIDRFETGGKGVNKYGETTKGSTAYGRYQFINSTGSQYCAKVGNGCCGVWRSNTPKGRDCQDKMFELFTKDNMSKLDKYGIPLNTCNLYLLHQQGPGGLLWIRGGKNPYGNFNRLKEVVYKNVGSKYRALALNASSEEKLREIYIDFWNQKFGGDIMADVGTEVPLSSLIDSSKELHKKVEDLVEKRKSQARRGILLDMKKHNIYLNKVY